MAFLSPRLFASERKGSDACSSLTSDAADSVTHSELDEMLCTNRDMAGSGEADDVSLPAPSLASSSASPRTTPRLGDSSETAAQRRRRGLEEKIAKFNELQQKRREIQRLKSTESLDNLPPDEEAGPGVIEVLDTRRRNLPPDAADPEAPPRRARRHRDQRRHSTLSTISSDDEGAMHRLSDYEPGPGVYTEPPSRQSGHIQMHPYLRSSFEQLYEAGLGGKMIGFGAIDVLSADWMREEEEEEDARSSSSEASLVRLPARLRRSGSSGETTPTAGDSGAEERPIFPGQAAQESKASPQPPKRRSLPSVEEAEQRRREEKAAFPNKMAKLRTAPEDPTARRSFSKEGAKGERAVSRSGASFNFADRRSSFESASQASSDNESGHSFIHKSSSRAHIRPGDKVEEEEEEEAEKASPSAQAADKDHLHSRFYAWSHSRPQHELDTLEQSHNSTSFGMDVRLTQRSSFEFRTGQEPSLEASEAPVVAATAASRQRSEVAPPASRQRPDNGAAPAAFDAFVGLLRDNERAVPPLDLGRDSSEAEESAEEGWVKLEPRGTVQCDKWRREGPKEGRADGARIQHGTPGYVGRREGPIGREGCSATEPGPYERDAEARRARELRMRHRNGTEEKTAARNKPVGQDEAAGWSKVGHEMREAPTHDYWVRDRSAPAEKAEVGHAVELGHGVSGEVGRVERSRSEVGHVRISRPEVGQLMSGTEGLAGMSTPEVDQVGISRSAVGRVAMGREVGRGGMSRNVGYIGANREVGHARSASVGPPLPPRQAHPNCTDPQDLNSQPQQLRQLLHGKPDQVLRSRSFQKNRPGPQNGRLPSQEQHEAQIRPSAQGQVFASPPQGQTFDNPDFQKEGQVRPSFQGHVGDRRVNGSPPDRFNHLRRSGDYPQSPTKAGVRLEGPKGSGDYSHMRPNPGHAQLRISNSFNGQIGPSGHYQGQMKPADQPQGQMRPGDQFRGQVTSAGHVQGQNRLVNHLQVQMSPTDHLKFQMQSSGHLQGQMPSQGHLQGQMMSEGHLQRTSSSADNHQGRFGTANPLQGPTRSIDHLQGQMRPANHLQGQMRQANHLQGQMRPADHFQGQSISADHLQDQTRPANHLQDQTRPANHLQGQSISADHFQGQMKPAIHLQDQSISADRLQGQTRSSDNLQGQIRSSDNLQGQMRSADHLQGQIRSDDNLQGQMRSDDNLQGQIRSDDLLQGQPWPHERFQARFSRELGGPPPSRSSQGPVTRSVRPQDLRSHSFTDDDLRLHPRRPSSRARSSAGLQRHHSSVAASPAPPPPPPPLPPRQQPDPVVEAPPASLQRLRTAFEEADRKARAAAAEDDEEALREDFWREMATMERQERAGFAWDDDEDAWVTNAAKEKKWAVLKDPGDRQDPTADLERMFLDLDLDRDDLMDKAERRIVPDNVLDRLKALKEEDEDSDHVGPLSPSHLPSASPLPAPSGASTLQSHASTTRSYNHIPHRAPFPHRVRDDKAYRRLHPNVQAPTVNRRASSFSSGANSGFVSGMATPAELVEEKSDGKLRSASSVRARAEPSPTTADYLLPRETGTIERRRQWPPPFAEDPDLKVDDMAYRRLVKPAQAARSQKDLIGKPRPTPFSEEEKAADSNGKGGGKQTWWPYARVHELKRQGAHQDVDDEII